MKKTSDIFNVSFFNSITELTGLYSFIHACASFYELLPDQGFFYKAMVVIFAWFSIGLCQVLLFSGDNKTFDKKFGRALNGEVIQRLALEEEELKKRLEEVSNIFSNRIQLPTTITCNAAIYFVSGRFELYTAVAGSVLAGMFLWVLFYKKLKSINPLMLDARYSRAYYDFLDRVAAKFLVGFSVLVASIFFVAHSYT